MVVNLHAAEVDQDGALPFGLVENRYRLVRGTGEVGLALDVQRPGLKRSFPAGFGQSDRIKDAFGNLIFAGRG